MLQWERVETYMCNGNSQTNRPDLVFTLCRTSSPLRCTGSFPTTRSLPPTSFLCLYLLCILLYRLLYHLLFILSLPLFPFVSCSIALSLLYPFRATGARVLVQIPRLVLAQPETLWVEPPIAPCIAP